jgi:hypothetical protein
MDGLNVELIDSSALQATHPAKNYGGWEGKTYAVMHSGFQRVLFLDADAYLVSDPTPLFALLDDHRYVYWADHGPGNACAPIPNELPNHQNGGEYLVNLATYWREMQAARFLDNQSAIFYRAGNAIGDECTTRLVRSLIKDRGVFRADWVDRTRGVGVLCRYPAYGPAYVAHRMRRESKLFLGTVPRTNYRWPLEGQVMRLFEELSPDYQAKKEAERVAKLPSSKRRRRQAILAGWRRGGSKCSRTSERSEQSEGRASCP